MHIICFHCSANMVKCRCDKNVIYNKIYVTVVIIHLTRYEVIPNKDIMVCYYE